MAGLFDPLSTRPRRIADQLAEMLDPASAGDRGTVRPFIAGSMQGAGDVLSDMTSPLSLLSMALGAGGLKYLAKGAKSAPKIVKEMIDLGPEFVAQGDEAAYNAMRAKRMADEAKKVKDVAQRGGSRRAISPTSSKEVTEFMKARGRSRYKGD